MNFGPIENASIDFSKNITAIYGENNIGKSYYLQVAYLVIKYILKNTSSIRENYHERRFWYHYDLSTNTKTKLKEIVNSSSDANITDIVKEELIYKINQYFFIPFIKALENTFQNFNSNLKKNATIMIESCEKSTKKNMVICLSSGIIEISHNILDVFIKPTKSYLTQRITKNKETYYYQLDEKEYIFNSIGAKTDMLLYEFLSSFTSNIDSVYFLPASRSGIYTGLSAFSNIIAELSKNKSILTRKIELPGLSESVSDYFITLNEIISKGYYSNLQRNEDTMRRLDEEIEFSILNGEVKFDKNTNSLLYSPKGKKINLNMQEVSSMVSEISPIVAFFRMIIYKKNTYNKRKLINKNTLLFIEEPEAHLHPINQMKLMYIFSRIDEISCQLVMSTHSNYIFNKLNNFVIANILDSEKYLPILMKSNGHGSICNIMDINEFGVEDLNFMESTLDLLSERDNLLIKKLKEI